MKSYTSLEQSRKLAGILPLESADMLFQLGEDKYADSIRVPLTKKHWEQMMPDINPCWSLAALLSVLPKKCYPVKDHETNLILGKPKDKWCALYWDVTGMQHGEETLADNPVDACYEMILKLHEFKML